MVGKIKYVDRVLFVSPCCIGLCTSKAQFLKELKRLKLNEYAFEWMSDDCNGKTHFLENKSTGGKICIVCIDAVIRNGSKKSTLKGPALYGLIVHEAVHVWQAIRDDIGEENPSAEFEAYSIQAISQRLMEAI